MKLHIVPTQFIDKAWKEGASNLEAACNASGGEITIDQLKLMLLRGERTLVRMDNETGIVGWAVYVIELRPNFRVFHVGELYAPNAHFEGFYDLLKEMAQAYGCERIRYSSKPAQARLFQHKLGSELVYSTYEIKL